MPRNGSKAGAGKYILKSIYGSPVSIQFLEAESELTTFHVDYCMSHYVANHLGDQGKKGLLRMIFTQLHFLQANVSNCMFEKI